MYIATLRWAAALWTQGTKAIMWVVSIRLDRASGDHCSVHGPADKCTLLNTAMRCFSCSYVLSRKCAAPISIAPCARAPSRSRCLWVYKSVGRVVERSRTVPTIRVHRAQHVTSDGSDINFNPAENLRLPDLASDTPLR
jgi:hypothetical protein